MKGVKAGYDKTGRILKCLSGRKRLYIVILFLTGGVLFSAKAQKSDSATTKRFTSAVAKEQIYHPDSSHSPRKAVIRSLILPGLGQLYNRQWWKVPLIYGALGSFAYFTVLNARNYSDYLTVAKFKQQGISINDIPKTDPHYALYKQYNDIPAASIIAAKDGSRRDRDLSILGFLGFWGINVIDAYIDAKFKHSFSLDNNFGIKVSPSVIGQPLYAANFNTFTPAMKLTLNLK